MESESTDYLVINPKDLKLSFKVPVDKLEEDSLTITEFKKKFQNILEKQFNLKDDKAVELTNFNLRNGISFPYSHKELKHISYFKDVQPFFYEFKIKTPIKLNIRHSDGKVKQYVFTNEYAGMTQLLKKCQKYENQHYRNLALKVIGGKIFKSYLTVKKLAEDTEKKGTKYEIIVNGATFKFMTKAPGIEDFEHQFKFVSKILQIKAKII